jgi:sugar phosphate isomerase/epimerase
MIKIGATTLPIAGWVADPRRPEESRLLRLGAIRQLVEGYGLPAVELTLDFGLVYPQVFDRSFYTTVADLQQELGFVCTVHLPFLWIDPASLNEPLRQVSADGLCQAIELARPVDVHTYALHLWGMTSTQITILLRDPAQRPAILDALLNQAGRSLAQLCELVDPRDLCLENLEDPLFDHVLPLVEGAGVSICLDVGHLAWRGDSEAEFLTRYGDRIREAHLHDAVRASPDGRTQFRDHLALGQGQVDYPAFLRRLADLDHEVVVILENNSQADLEQSLERVRA